MWLALLLLLKLMFFPVQAQGFDAGAELWLPGDFDGDGLRDVAVVNRESGLIRLGRGQAGGDLAWSPASASGLAGITGIAADRFEDPARDGLVLVSPEADRVVRWSFNAVAPTSPSLTFIPIDGLGPVLVAPGASAASAGGRPQLAVVSALNAGPAVNRLHLLRHRAGAFQPDAQEAFGAGVGFLGRADLGATIGARNFVLRDGAGGLRLEVHDFGGPNRGVLATAVVHGVTSQARALALPVSEGTADLLVFEAGRAEVRWLRLSVAGDGTAALAAPVTLGLAAGLEEVLPLEAGPTWKVAVREQGGQRVAVYRFNPTAPAGPRLERQGDFTMAPSDSVLGVVPGSGGELLVLAGDGSNGRVARSIRLAPDGGGYVELSRQSLPPITPWMLGANLLLLPDAPFIREDWLPVARLRAGDWTRSVNVVPFPGTGHAMAESFGGAAAGLSSPVSWDFAMPTGAMAGLVSQYRPNVSVFSWAPVSEDPMPSVVPTPAAGFCDAGTVVRLATSPNALTAFGDVWYRLDQGEWRAYGGSIGPLSRNVVLDFQWRRNRDGARGPIGRATFSIRPSGSEPDCDRDGVPDLVELARGLDPCASGPDGDGDGFSDLAEVVHGTDPNNRDIKPPDTFAQPDLERSVQVILTPQSLTGAADSPPLLAPSLALDPASSTPSPPTRLWLRDPFGQSAASVVPTRFAADPNAGNLPYAETRLLPAPPDLPPAGAFTARDASFAPGFLIAITGDPFAIRLPDGSTRPNAGRELIGFVPPPSTVPDRLGFIRGAGSDAEEAARWVTEARAFYAARPSPVEVTPVDYLTSMEVLLVEYTVGQLLFQRGNVAAPRVTLTPFRAGENLARPDRVPVPAQAFLPFHDDLLRALQERTDGGLPAYSLAEMRLFIRNALRDAGASGSTLRSVAAEFYRIAALPPTPAASLPTSPIDSIRSFLHGGNLHQAIMTGPHWSLPAAQVEAARAAVVELPARVPARVEREWIALVRGNLAPGECAPLFEEGTSQALALVDGRGRPYPLEFGFEVPLETRVRVRGYAFTGGTVACPGLAIEPTRLELLTLPAENVPDRNGNGVADGLERYYLGALISDPDADRDGDGVPDLEELRRGTDPGEAPATPPFRAFGLQVAALGQARPTLNGTGQLVLSDVTTSGQDGVRFQTGETEGIRLDFDRLLETTSLPAGAELKVTVLGPEGTPMAVLRFARNIWNQIETIPDFEGVGSGTYRLRLYRFGQREYDLPGRVAQPLGEWPISNALWHDAFPQALRVSLRPGQGLTFEYDLGPGRSTVVYEGGFSQFSQPDRVEMFPDEVGAQVPTFLTGLELQVTAGAETAITGVAITRFGVETRGAYGSGLVGSGRDLLAVRTQPEPPTLPAPPSADAPPTWDLSNPLGRFGDWNPGNPARFQGADRAEPVLCYLDLTGSATSPFLARVYRPGKSSVRWQWDVPELADGTFVKAEVGGPLDHTPGQPTVTFGAISIIRVGGQFVLGIEPSASSLRLQPGLALESAPDDCELIARLPDGSLRTVRGRPAALKVSLAAVGAAIPSFAVARVEADGDLSMGFERPEGAVPWSVSWPEGASVAVTALHWKLKLARPLTAGSLRGLILSGNLAAPVRLTSLDTSTANPAPGLTFGGHPVLPLGHARLRLDAFGSLVLNGLSPSGQDGFRLYHEAGLPIQLDFGPPNLGLGLSPITGTTVQLAAIDPSGDGTPESVLDGSTCASSFLPFAVRFPRLGAVTCTLRLSLGGTDWITLPGQPATAAGGCFLFFPQEPNGPSHVSARAEGGQFAWTMAWNHPLYLYVLGGSSYRIDRLEVVSEGALRAPAATVLELRASHLGSWTLPTFASPPGSGSPDLSFRLEAGRLKIEWDPGASGSARLRMGPSVTGPWADLGLGEDRPGGRRGFDLETSGREGYVWLQTPNADPNRASLPFTHAQPRTVENPWRVGDLEFTALEPDGTHAPEARISLYRDDLTMGYEVKHQVELKLAQPRPHVEIDFISGSGMIEFQAYDDLGAALPPYQLFRPTSNYGEAVTFTGASRPLARVVITTSGGLTRIMRIRAGPQPLPWGRDVAELAVRPLRPFQPVGDTLWTFLDAAGTGLMPVLRAEAGETGFELARTTQIAFATDHRAAELRLVVGEGGATVAVDAYAVGLGGFASLPDTAYPAGVHLLKVDDFCSPIDCGATLRYVRLRLSAGRAIVSRVGTQFFEE